VPIRGWACGWRGWAVDAGPRFEPVEIETANEAIAADPFDPAVLTMQPSSGIEARPAIDLRELDSFSSETQK
jgi:hypothetical protein